MAEIARIISKELTCWKFGQSMKSKTQIANSIKQLMVWALLDIVSIVACVKHNMLLM